MSTVMIKIIIIIGLLADKRLSQFAPLFNNPMHPSETIDKRINIEKPFA